MHPSSFRTACHATVRQADAVLYARAAGGVYDREDRNAHLKNSSIQRRTWRAPGT